MNTYLDEAKRHLQKLPAFLEKNAPFITSRYQKNKQAFNEIGLGLCALFAVLCLVLLPYDSIELKEVIELFFKVVGGTAILFGAYFAWKRLEVNQEGQITERFTRAIDQLGATHSDGRKNLEVRLGGIYALERIAKDSVKDHWPIMEVLTAYLVEHAPKRPSDLMPTSNQRFVTPDTRAILNVIARRHWEYEVGTENTISLVNLELSDTELSHAHFKYSQISNTNLNEAMWLGTNFEKACISGSAMNSSCFAGSNFEGAQIRLVGFVDSDFEEANMVNVYFEKCNFQGALMHSVQLQGAEFPLATGLTKEQIESTIIDRETVLPSYLMDDSEWYEAQIERSEKWLAELQES